MTIPEWLVATVLLNLIFITVYATVQTKELGRLHKKCNDLLNQNVHLQNELRGKRKEVHRLKQSWN